MVTDKMIEALGAETTVDDHLRNLIQLMKRGGRVSVTDIPNDPTFLSSNFGGPTVQAMAEKIESALSPGVEPVAIYKGNGLVDCGDSGHHNIELLKLISANTPLYTAPPAPSVAVKALEWEGNVAQTPFGAYTVGENVDDRFQWTFHSYPYGSPDDLEHPDAESAQAAAQADYEARIRSALSAQVQDVAIPEGCKLVPDKADDAWAERYCELTNKHPDGMQSTSSNDGWVSTTFREMSKREIAAMLAAAPAAKQGEGE